MCCILLVGESDESGERDTNVSNYGKSNWYFILCIFGQERCHNII